MVSKCAAAVRRLTEEMLVSVEMALKTKKWNTLPTIVARALASMVAPRLAPTASSQHHMYRSFNWKGMDSHMTETKSHSASTSLTALQKLLNDRLVGLDGNE